MERFVTRHRDRIDGILTGFDRMLFRGSLRSICHEQGLKAYLATHHILWKDFGTGVNEISTQLKVHGQTVAAHAERPYL